MQPDPKDEKYEVEVIEDGAAARADDPETKNIEEEGDPFGDNFA